MSINKILTEKILPIFFLFLMLGTGAGEASGQTDYSGTYFIGSRDYFAGNKSTNYYLCPTVDWNYYTSSFPYYTDTADPNNVMPFLTTYQCRDGSNGYTASDAVWIIEKKSGTSYYYIKHANTGRYLTYNVAMGNNSNVGRMRLHLEASPADDDALFSIAWVKGTSSYDIITKKSGPEANRKYLNITGASGGKTGNQLSLRATDVRNDGPSNMNVGGILGLWTSGSSGDQNSRWYLEPAVTIDPPTITNNETVTNTFTITAAEGATIYYTTDGNTPTESSSVYSTPITQTENMTVIKAIAKASSDDYHTAVTTYDIPICDRPVITVANNTVTITAAEGTAIYYTTDDTEATTSSTPYTGAFSLGSATAIRAIAANKPGFYKSSEAFYYAMVEVHSSSEITYMTRSYKLASDFTSTASIGTAEAPFKGTIDGNMVTLSGLNHPLVGFADGAIIKNVILDNVSISENDNGNAGAICYEAMGDTRIYNCGVLATESTANTDDDGYTYLTSCSSTVSGSNYVGGIVGLLDGTSRVINCFSYANVSRGAYVGGIVGYNNVATTASNLRTMVMNCMFYGEVSGTSIAPIYNGAIITNVGENTGVSNFNYFRLESSYIKNTDITKVYHCALGAETRFLQRFEFFRHLLNSNRELAAWWATGNVDNKDEMMKWVLEPSQIGTTTPYPILNTPRKYASVVNYTPNETAYDEAHRKQGRKLTNIGDNGVLHVTIQMGDGEVFERPFKGTNNAATISNSSVDLIITDKDEAHFNFNYGKVQLPYYNDYGTQNYKDGRVVTGWKIVSITGGTAGSYSTGADVTYTNGVLTKTPYNFADRKCTNKDLYGTGGSKRVFNQGAYWDVPEGVTGITIEPYWGKAVYLGDAYLDVVYNSGMTVAYNVTTVGGGQHYDNGVNTFNSQLVYTSMANAVSALSINSSHNVYDYAVVLVGNYHQYNSIEKENKPYTVTSVDLDGDNEPDYSFILRFNDRTQFHPVRYDFLNLIGLGMAQKSTGGTGSYNFGIMQPKYWFEVTNTALFRVTQFEYAPKDRSKQPIILQGGVMEQWVTQQQSAGDVVSYFHVGGNVWFKEFHRGSHQDNPDKSTPHPPVSVTGGDFNKFYLTGLYQSQAAIVDDNAECYINGGRFGEMAGAGMEGIGKTDGKGNVTWLIDNADIKNFYGGGINYDKPVHGNIHTIISNSYVDQFCGGPKFGDMEEGRTVITSATNCNFGTYFGAGYGGNAYNRYAPTNQNSVTNIDWNSWVGDEYTQSYNPTYGGVSTQIDYQFIPRSDNTTNVARLWVEFVGFSLATCKNVTSTLTGCKITGNFYGGGSLGKVEGTVTSTLTDCTVEGSAFGAGFSASLPPVEVDSIGFRVEPFFYEDLGTYRFGVKGKTTTYTWQHGDAVSIDKDKHILYTTADLTTLGTVTEKVTLNINGTTTVKESVYGGGEESVVENDTEVRVTSGTIGYADAPRYGELVGNVYGGGKGKADDKLAGLVKGNTNVTISQTENKTTKIYHNIYGGGAYGSVGEFDYADESYHTTHPEVAVGMPKGRKDGATGGKCTVTITGGTIGTNGRENGMVFGSSRGDVSAPVGDVNPIDPNDYLAWVYDTHVIIGTSGSDDGPQINGSVYGSGENGHTFNKAQVDVHSGTIGIETGEKITYENGIEYEGPQYPYRGNVYGGGCGTDMYDSNGDKKEDKFNFLAGIVLGNTEVNIDGGHVIHNVYGGGAMGSVGTYDQFEAYKSEPIGKPTHCVDGTGECTVTISGGEIGVKGAKMKTDGSVGPDDYGHVFGAGRGDVLDPIAYGNVEICGYFGSTELTVRGTAFVRGSVYGGSESGHVLGDTHVVIGGDTPSDNLCQIGSGDGVENAYTAEEWAAAESSLTLKPVNHWDWVNNGRTYDQYADENGNYTGNISAEGGYIVATDGHTFYGNVFAGGSGYYPYAQGKWLKTAGRVEGNAEVIIKGGHILNNIYGGCEMSDVLRDAKVTMTGGTVGVPRAKADILLLPTVGHVYGAGMGDKRIFFNQDTNVASSTVEVSGGKVYGSVHGGGEDGHVLGLAKTTISGDVEIGSVKDGTTSGYDGNVFGGGQGSPTALTAGTVGGNVDLSIQGGTMHGSVYGGGRIASVGTYFELAKLDDGSDNPDYGKMQEGPEHGYITVNLKGGEIKQNVYGGCMGVRGMAAVDQVRFAISKNITVNLNENVADGEKGCIVGGNIFGCNNLNSSPQEDVKVHIFATQNEAAERITNPTEGAQTAKVKGRYDVNAVYGGGNMAAYLPIGGKETTYSTDVIIDGCERTSIRYVYGGGNAASTPATKVTVNGTYEIDELFGGGNGADRITYNEGAKYEDNPGANVGFYVYEENIAGETDTPENRAANYGYGTGVAEVNILGGTINKVFGGSNTKGNVRKTAVTLLEEKQEGENCCPFNVGEVYGGGKSAPMDANAKLLMLCIPGLRSAYGGAEAADIQGGVTLNITNGTFERVFGGNNLSGTIRGPIEVNIEETGCRPIIIGELYGGGNQAPYSVYGYNDDGTIIETGTNKVYKDPVVNVKSFTSIGEIYGGGYGSTATMVGDPTVNVNVTADPTSEAQTKTYKDSEEQTKFYSDYAGETKTIGDHSVILPPHVKGKMGVINNVFGGGNAAPVKGNTQVNIGTTEEVYMLVNQELTIGTTDVSGFYIRTGGSGTTADPYEYTPATGTAVDGTTYYKRYSVLGADIRGNVYGGGNNAEVTGNTDVIIGKKKTE